MTLNPPARRGQLFAAGGSFAERGQTRRGRGADPARRRREQSLLDAHRHAQHRSGRAQRIAGDALDKAAQLGPQRRRRQDFADRLQPFERDRRGRFFARVLARAVPHHADHAARSEADAHKAARLGECRALRHQVIERLGQGQRQHDPDPGQPSGRVALRLALPVILPVVRPGAVGRAVGHRYTHPRAGRPRLRFGWMSAGHGSGFRCCWMITRCPALRSQRSPLPAGAR